jgi:hypothetical protein
MGHLKQPTNRADCEVELAPQHRNNPKNFQIRKSWLLNRHAYAGHYRAIWFCGNI